MRPPRILPCLCAFAALSIARGADAPSPAPAPSVTLDLTDTSRIIGTPEMDHLKITTEYADLDIKMSLIDSIQLGDAGRTADINLKNGDHVTGKLEAVKITVKAMFGEVTIPLSMVDSIEMQGASGWGISNENGLVLRYSFDVVLNNNVPDESGSGNDGTARGADTVARGKVNAAMGFNGDRQVVIIKNSATLQNQSFTIAAWIKRGSKEKVSTASKTAQLFGYGDGGYGFGIDAEGHLLAGRNGAAAVSSRCKIDDDAFHHVIVTKDGKKVVFYLDGTAYPANDIDATFDFNTPVGVGARPDTLEDGFMGLIDELEVFNRALSDDEVKAIYDSRK